jgi:hypothetical protein
MDFTSEQIAAAKAAQSPEELKALCAENGMKLTDEEAKSHFAALHSEGQLADDELDAVSGGICEEKYTTACIKGLPDTGGVRPTVFHDPKCNGCQYATYLGPVTHRMGDGTKVQSTKERYQCNRP